MAYDTPRIQTDSGFRDDYVFRSDVDSDAGGYSAYGETSNTTTITRPSPSGAQLGDVFDDPDHGDPGRDRMAVHLLWELMLVLGTIAVAFLLLRGHRSAVSGAGLRDLMAYGAMLGLLAVGVGLSLRAYVPNLAVGAIAAASAQYFAEHAGSGTVPTAGITGALGLGAGVAIAILVVGFNVPAWAASLGAALALLVWIEDRAGVLKAPGYQASEHAAYWLAGFAGLALLGALLGMIKPVRRTVGRYRPTTDPGRRRGVGAAATAFLAIVASSGFASIAGVLLASGAGKAGPSDGALNPAHGVLALTGLALGCALLGGTSALGRRGGIFGTVLAVALVALVLRYADVSHRNVATIAVAAAAIGLGLVVTRLVEAFGRP